MKISVMDGGNYLKGLLLLIRKDRKVTAPEIQLIKRVGETLGFERTFCDNALGEILENKYIVDAPPKFSTKHIAVKFIKDGLKLAFSDHEMHPSEAAWLRSVAELNGLDAAWFRRESVHAASKTQLPLRLEVDDLTVAYS